MKFSAISDLFAHRQTQMFTSRVSEKMRVSAKELSTGLRADQLAASGGDVSRLHAIDAELTRMGGYGDAISAARGRLDATQAALETIRTAGEAIGIDLLSEVKLQDLQGALAHAADARAAFESVVATLNASYGGRALFAGAQADGPSLLDADAILSAVTALTAPEITLTGVQAQIDGYFLAAGGGFETSAYLGSGADASDVEVAPSERIAFDVRADADAFRKLLAGLATAVVATEGHFTGGDAMVLPLLQDAAERAMGAMGDLDDLRLTVGVRQERVERAAALVAGRKSALELARTSILGKDQYEAASEFQALESQLDAAFTVAVRMSNMRLVNYLR